MTGNPLVSVLMTCYNRERYIGEAMESVLASTYTNLELIIVDDCSKDSSVRIARGYADKDPRVKVQVNETNQGDYGNRIRAANLAQGKYLKYVDADDYMYPWGLQLLVEMMEKFPDAGYGFCSLLPDDNAWYPFKLSPAETYRYNYFKTSIFHKAPLSAIIRKDAYEAIGGFSGRRYYGDFELWHLLSLKFPVVLMPEGMVWHRTHDEQESKNNRENPRVPHSYDAALLNFFATESRIPLTDEEKAIITGKLRKKMNRILLVNFAKGRYKEVRDMLKLEKSGEHFFKKIG